MDILEVRNPEPIINLHNLNTMLNIAYPNIHKILLIRHLHLNKISNNSNDILLKRIL